MLEPQLRHSRLNIHVVLGFLLGTVASLFCLFFAIFLGSTLGPRHLHSFPVFTALALIGLVLIAIKNARRSQFAIGAAVALGLALLLDGAYMIASFR